MKKRTRRRKKMGRPPLGANKRTHRIMISLTPAEAARLIHRATEARAPSLAVFIRDLLAQS